MLISADKVYEDADLIFQQDLAPAHTAKSTNTWFNDHGITDHMIGQQTRLTWTPHLVPDQVLSAYIYMNILFSRLTYLYKKSFV